MVSQFGSVDNIFLPSETSIKQTKIRRELAETEALLERSHSGLREIFERTREVNGQRWLMIDLEDDGELCCDALRLIEIKSRC